jgi:RNA polymerase sigma-70 factor, ECF subfamily
MTTSVKTEDDKELLGRMARGDEDAFTELYRRRQGAVFRFALQMSGSSAVAEDVTQEVFMALIKGSSGFDPNRGNFQAYLYGMARNHVLRRIESDRNFLSFESEADDEPAPALRISSGEDPLRLLTRSETVENVRAAVLRLPAHYREVVVLCDLHEMSYAETAEALNCAIGTVRSRLHRARSMLLEKLSATESPGVTAPATDTARCFA